MKLTLPLSSALALRAAFHAMRGQFSFKVGEVTITPPMFGIEDGMVRLKIHRNTKVLDGIFSSFQTDIKFLQDEALVGTQTKQQKDDMLNAHYAKVLAESRDLSGLTPLTAAQLEVGKNGNPMGLWADDMLAAFDQFLTASEPTNAEGQ